MSETLRIGEVARRAGVSVDTVRYYEREGILDAPPRRASGYRAFPEQTVRRVRFIKRAQRLGFSLKGIVQLLATRADPGGRAREVKRATTARAAEIDERIHELTQIRDALLALERSCDGRGPASGCTILDALEDVDAAR